jgi:hypothetical protein
VAASPNIIIFTALLTTGHVLPFALLLLGAFVRPAESTFVVILAAAVLSVAPRIAAASRFRQPFAVSLLHPLAILVFLGIQWYAFVRSLLGTPATWKGRTYQRT